MKRFRKLVARQLDEARVQREGTVIAPMPRAQLPDDMKDLERECHLIPEAGGDCLTAINFFEDAQDLISDSLLMPQNADRFIELLEYADARMDIALKHFYDFLAVARN